MLGEVFFCCCCGIYTGNLITRSLFNIYTSGGGSFVCVVCVCGGTRVVVCVFNTFMQMDLLHSSLEFNDIGIYIILCLPERISGLYTWHFDFEEAIYTTKVIDPVFANIIIWGPCVRWCWYKMCRLVTLEIRSRHPLSNVYCSFFDHYFVFVPFSPFWGGKGVT